MTLKRKRVPFEGLEEGETNAKKQPCWPENEGGQQVCGQGWWPSLPAENTQPHPAELLSPPFWSPQLAHPDPGQPVLSMRAEDMEMEEHPSQEMTNNNNNIPVEMSAEAVSQPCLQCLSGQPVSVQGHLLHMLDSSSLPTATESISFASHYIPLPWKTL